MNKEFIVEFIYNGRKYCLESTNDKEYFYKIWGGARKTFYEVVLLEAIKKRNLRGIYIDLGSHLGNHSVFFATQCPCTKLYCVDACDYLLPFLKRNLERNGVTIPYEIYNYAIREKRGWVRLSDYNPVNPGRMKVISDEGGKIPAITINELFGNLTNVVVLKMDIELSEISAIKGAVKFLKNNNPIITAELKMTSDFLKFRTLMKKHGYETDEINYAATPTFIFERR